jgi:hypothetical protein
MEDVSLIHERWYFRKFRLSKVSKPQQCILTKTSNSKSFCKVFVHLKTNFQQK